MAEYMYIERDEAIAALTEFRDDQTVSKYVSIENCLVARDAIERATKVIESLPAAERRRMSMLRLYVKDNTSGRVHEYGTNPHDALILQDDGSLHYENLQCCVGTMFPTEGYSFCNEDGTIPKWDEKYEAEPYIDIGGEYYNKPTYYDRQLKPCKTCGKVKSQKMRTDELLYRLREIMPEIGENDVFEYAEQDIAEYEITEVCPHCENEITMQWDVEESGYKAHCPVCGKRLMLCSACHDDGYACDYETETDSCRFNDLVRSIVDSRE